MATGAAKTDTFLGQRYRRLAKRMPKAKALAAIERSILVIIFALLSNPTTTFEDLGADFYDNRINKDRRTRNLVHQLETLGHQVTLTPAA
jgi:transposase